MTVKERIKKLEIRSVCRLMKRCTDPDEYFDLQKRQSRILQAQEFRKNMNDTKTATVRNGKVNEIKLSNYGFITTQIDL